MRIKSLSFGNFRSYHTLGLEFDPLMKQVFCGSNGVGKTNILEAISVLSLTKSCLGAQEEELIHWGDDFYTLRADIVSDEGEGKNVEVVFQVSPRKQKACFVNDVKRSVTEFIGTLPSTIFLPHHLELFTGSPAVRRQWLDQLLCQVSSDYLRALGTYQKVLKQRNSLLKNIADKRANWDDCAIWDAELATYAAKVTAKRLELLEVWQCTIEKEIQALGEVGWDNIKIRYVRKGKERDELVLKQEYIDLLTHYRERDLILQATTVGPHREDWNIEVAKRPITSFASRGQQRTVLLALIFLQVSYLEIARGEKPVILLDDVFSELDEAHRERLLQSFSDYQVFITTTHLPEKLSEDIQVRMVENGNVLNGTLLNG